MTWRVLTGPSETLLRSLPANSIDSIVTDPPAWIDFMGRKWDSSDGYARFRAVMIECARVLKPGGYALVWAIPRTSHYTALGIEDGGFEIRDRIHHVFGSGMPHARDASKAIDIELLGPELGLAMRPVVGEYRVGGNAGMTTEEKGGTYGVGVGTADAITLKRTTGATPAARERDDWHTNLKPGCEDWWIARKPLEGTLAANLLVHGTGALNIGACRVPRDWDERGEAWKASGVSLDPTAEKIAAPPGQGMILHPGGGWPANLVLSHSDMCAVLGQCAPDCPVGQMDEQAGPKKSGTFREGAVYERAGNVYGKMGPSSGNRGATFGDSGGASRYFNVFYAPKAPRAEREAGCNTLPARTGGEATGRKDGSAGVDRPQAGAGRGGGRKNIHPTVKGLELMRYLVRLVTPPGGIVPDPYNGSGSTGCAAVAEGFDYLGIDESAEYCEIARHRIAYWEKMR